MSNHNVQKANNKGDRSNRSDANQESRNGAKDSQSPTSRYPTFYLYTKLGQNETKKLKKAINNREERKVLAEIFDLPAALNPLDENHSVEELKLDFHYINYNFCMDNQFSNEKTSTLLAILDHILHKMLSDHLTPETGYGMLRSMLKDHSFQRPPYGIYIFQGDEIAKIEQFALRSFLRHFSLYEFAFTPRVELVLRTQPILNQKFNTKQHCLDEAEEVSKEEAEQIAAFLGQIDHDTTIQSSRTAGNAQELSARQGTGRQMNNSEAPAMSASGSVARVGTQGSAGGPSVVPDDVANITIGGQSQAGTAMDIDWKKVGNIYKSDATLDEVMAMEMGRLNRSIETKLEQQVQLAENRKTQESAAGKK